MLTAHRNTYFKERVFFMAVPSFVLTHARRVRGQCAPWMISIQSRNQSCAEEDVKYVPFPLRLLGENKNPPHSMHTK